MSPQPWESAELLSGFGGSPKSLSRTRLRDDPRREPIGVVVARFLDEHPIEEVVATEGALKRVAKVDGGEWCGPCPLCGGDDRLRVWPTPAEGHGRAWCRQCQISGDALNWSMRIAGMDPTERGATGRFLRGQLGYDWDDSEPDSRTPRFESATQQSASVRVVGSYESTQQVSKPPLDEPIEVVAPPESGQQLSKPAFDPATRPPPPESIWPAGTVPVDELLDASRTGVWQTDLHRRVTEPTACYCCGGLRWWRRKDAGLGTPGPLICERCHPAAVEADLIEWIDVPTGFHPLCSTCGYSHFWQHHGESEWHCSRCTVEPEFGPGVRLLSVPGGEL